MIKDTLINATTIGDQYWSSISELRDGDLVVSWLSNGEDGTADIYAQHFEASGIKRGGEIIVNATITGSQYGSSSAALQDGGFVVIWLSDHGESGGDIYAQRFDASGVKQGNELLVNTTTVNHQDWPSIAALQDGGFVASWQSFDQDVVNADIYVQRYDVSGTKQGDELLVNTTIVGNQWGPSIIVLQNGGFVVSWRSENPEAKADDIIYVQLFDANGAKLGNELPVNAVDREYFLFPQSITALQDGGFVVSWISDDGDGAGIYAQRFDANGAKLGDEFPLNTTTTGDQFDPSITALNNGGFVASWVSDDEDGMGIYAQRFDASGAKLGNELLVNTTTTGDQFLPSITALQDGGFVISWDSLISDSQNIFDSDVYAQRFDAAGNKVAWISLSALPVADRLFNWAESIYSDLFPDQPGSTEILGYYARLYENGNALGEQDGSIYFYDGNAIILVGTVNDFLPDAIAAGF